MNKKLIFGAFVMAIACAGAIGVSNFGQGKKVADDSFTLANVEALSDPDVTPGRPCSGYREWGVNGFLQTTKEFYDCTCTLRSGKRPKGNCQ